MGREHPAGGLPGEGGDERGSRGVETWIDDTVLNAALSGFLLIIAVFWAKYAFNRLWQAHLRQRAAPALAAAEAAGLTLRPDGYRPRLVAEGQGIRLEWRGGVLGERCVLTREGRREVLPLLTAPDAVRAAVAGGPIPWEEPRPWEDPGPQDATTG